jgi:HEAT repeat protein
MDRQPLRRRLMLGPLLLGLTALACLQAWGHEPKRPAGGPPPIDDSPAAEPPKEALRYDGKSFDQWRTRLLTELKPEKRVEAIKALEALGVNGYGADAAAAILLTLKRYSDAARDDSDTYQPVADAALNACKKMGAAATPALRKGLKDPNHFVRQFACDVLVGVGQEAREAIPDLVAAVRDKDPNVRQASIKAIRAIDPKAEGVVAAVTAALKDSDSDVGCLAAIVVGEIGPDAKHAAPLLVAMVKEYKDRWCRNAALRALGQVKGISPDLVPLLAGLLKDYDKDIRRMAIEYLSQVGPREAIPAIQELLRLTSPPSPASAGLIPVSAIGAPASLPNADPADPYDKAVEEVLKQIKK